MNQQQPTNSPEDGSGATDPQTGIERDLLRYQSFELDGKRTGGHDRSYLNRIIFEDGAEGRSFLDIGSFLGYFCVEALKRGGQAATGIEPDRESVRHAVSLASAAGVSPRYLHGDFEEWDFGAEQFDVVLCLNVLHHMYDSVGAIAKMKKLARRKIVIEFAAPSTRDLFHRSLSPLTVLANALPAIVLGNPRLNTDIGERSFVFTPKAMRVLFDKHSCAFEPARISRSPFKGRWILEARRRDLGHVAFVCGPTSSGKSTAFGRMMSDAALRGALGLETADWTALHGHEIDIPNGRNERVLVHYDLLRPYRRSIRAFHRDPRCELLDVAERVSAVTLMTAPNLLRKQLLQAAGASDSEGLSKRHRDLYARYASRAFLEDWYQSWFDYLQRHAAKLIGNRLLVREEDGSESIREATQWRDCLQGFYR